MTRQDSPTGGGALALMFWGGVAAAPVAALMIVFADGVGAVKIAAGVAVLAVILVALATMLRDGGAGQGELEEVIFEESDALRHDLREDIKSAVRSVNKAFTERSQVANQELQALRVEVDELRGRLDEAREQLVEAVATLQPAEAPTPTARHATNNGQDRAGWRTPAADPAPANLPALPAAPSIAPAGHSTASAYSSAATDYGSAASAYSGAGPDDGSAQAAYGGGTTGYRSRHWPQQASSDGYRDLYNNGTSWSERAHTGDLGTDPLTGAGPTWTAEPAPSSLTPDPAGGYQWSVDAPTAWDQIPAYREPDRDDRWR
ncbi:hypothetical protein [Pilimelia columellifera]|uniref:Secreted protein n=1 Tax=Pilimelia columellifera subsp. columellifera TaxID=706583 RepID=A0ABP6AMU0_9ACTN